MSTLPYIETVSSDPKSSLAKSNLINAVTPRFKTEYINVKKMTKFKNRKSGRHKLTYYLEI